MKRRGVALLELMVASILTAIIVGALSTAFAVVVRHQTNFALPRQEFERVAFFEDRVRNLLAKATFTNDANGTTYFVGDSIGGDSSVSGRLMFSMVGLRTDGGVVASADTEFTSRNQTFGTVGGVTEVSLSTTPVGDAANHQGLFIRKQTPSDSDHESGGYESVVSDQIASMTFEFWDSTAWVANWDAAAEGRLPEAVQVHYTWTTEPDQEHSFVVRIPNAQGALAATNAAGGGAQTP